MHVTPRQWGQGGAVENALAPRQDDGTLKPNAAVIETEDQFLFLEATGLIGVISHPHLAPSVDRRLVVEEAEAVAATGVGPLFMDRTSAQLAGYPVVAVNLAGGRHLPVADPEIEQVVGGGVTG